MYAIHKPGVVALRPLGLGDIYDAAFNTIRRNPKAMVGLALLVTTCCAAVPAIVSIVLAAYGHLDLFSGAGDPVSDTDPVGSLSGMFGVYGATFSARMLTALGEIVLTGMIAQVVFGAVLGRATSVGEAWQSVRGRVWRLFGLALLGGLIALVPLVLVVIAAIVLGYAVDSWGAGVAFGVPATILAICWAVYAEVRLISFSTPALVIERLRVLASLRRTWTLSRGQFWRIFGIWLLTALMIGLVSEILSVPFSIFGAVIALFAPTSQWAGLAVVAGSLLSTILVGALTTPFSAAVMALLYLDQRIRKEGYDVELIAAAGGPVPPSGPPPASTAG